MWNNYSNEKNSNKFHRAFLEISLTLFSKKKKKKKRRVWKRGTLGKSRWVSSLLPPTGNLDGRREADEYRFQWCRAPKVTRSRGCRRKAYRTPKGPPVDSLSMFESHTPVVVRAVDKGTESETTREKAGNGGASWPFSIEACTNAHEREGERERGLCDPPLCK